MRNYMPADRGGRISEEFDPVWPSLGWLHTRRHYMRWQLLPEHAYAGLASAAFRQEFPDR